MGEKLSVEKPAVYWFIIGLALMGASLVLVPTDTDYWTAYESCIGVIEGISCRANLVWPMLPPVITGAFGIGISLAALDDTKRYILNRM